MVNKNEIYTIEITGMSHEGAGIGKIDGYTVFVVGAMLGESIEIKIVKANKNFGFGKILNIISPSKERITPGCKISMQCGGCQLQHLSYEAQLTYKTQKVKDTIARIGKISDVTIHDTIGMDDPKRYRNKVQFPVGSKDGKAIIGFYSHRSHSIVETEECMIQDTQSENIAKAIIDFINMYKIPVYNEETHSGIIRHIVIRIGFKTEQIMVTIVTNGQKLPQKEKFIEELTKKYNNIKSIIQNINNDKTNVILGRKNIVLYGIDTIEDYIGDLKFRISSLSFYQVNPAQTLKLYRKALEYANLNGNEIVFDAYCGIGTISLFLAQKAKKVYGIEIVSQAIEDAKINAKINNIENAEFICGESESAIPKLYIEGIIGDIVVVDPPRKGCEIKLLDTIIEMKVKKMVYVSCDVGTLARDLNYLEQGGYKVIEIQPVDMFPWTHHVECVVLLNCGLQSVS